MTTETATRGADVLVQTLAEAGIDVMFGLAGTSTLAILDALKTGGKIRFVGARHEQAALSMADGYARTTGRPGVCIVHVGPGVTNLIISAATAHKENSPVIIITGNETSTSLGRDSYHEFDVLAAMKPVTKWSYQVVRADEIPMVVRNAITQSVTGRPRPVHIDIPKDFARKPVDLPTGRRGLLGFLKGRAQLPGVRCAPDPSLVSPIVDALLAAERPVILAGGGINWSGAWDDLRQLAESLTIPVATTDAARGVLPEDHPLCLGVVGRRMEERAPGKAIGEADLILAIGNKYADTSTENWTAVGPDTTLIQVDLVADDMGRQYPIDFAVLSDARLFLQALLANLNGRAIGNREPHRARTKQLQAMVVAEQEAFYQVKPGGAPGVKPQLLTKALNDVLDRNAIVGVDTGMFRHWADKVAIYTPRNNMKSGGFGAMGFTYAAILGAKVAHPDRQAVALMGDGGFAMVMQEIETAVRNNVPALAVIYNNFAFGSQRKQQIDLYGGRHIGVDHTNPDYGAVARLFGAAGAKVDREEDVRPALKELLASGRPAVLDVVVDREEKPEKWQTY